MTLKPHTDDERLNDLYHSYAAGRISRRGFIRGASALAAAGLSIPAWMLGDPAHAAAAQAAAGSAQPVLDLAEWSYFFVGVERAELARATYVNGKQMYVETFIPAQVRHPYPMVLVHGGGGQGLDWLGTPDGRRGWAQILLEEGYKVYVVDRPGHGRSPVSPRRERPVRRAGQHARRHLGTVHAAERRRARQRPVPQAAHAVAWHGRARIEGSRSVRRVAGRQLRQPERPAAPPAAADAVRPRRSAVAGPRAGTARMRWPRRRAGGRRRRAIPVAAPAVLGPSGAPAGGPDPQHLVWRQRGAMMLDKIGPAIIMTHSAGGPFGWLVAEIRPNLVKGIIAIEGGGQPFGGQNVWGMSTIPVAYDPPVVRSLRAQDEDESTRRSPAWPRTPFRKSRRAS